MIFGSWQALRDRRESSWVHQALATALVKLSLAFLVESALVERSVLRSEKERG